MSRTIIRTIHHDDGTRRVHFFARDDATFGFCEEQFITEPFVSGWVPVLQHNETYCTTEDILMREARGRVGWLASHLAQQSHAPDPASGSDSSGESSPPAR